MAGVNKVIILGRLGADPEFKSISPETRICNMRVATSETWRDKQSGDRKERTEWHSITIFNEHLVKIAEQYLKKGSQVYIEGALQTRKWQDNSGNDRYSTEVVLKQYAGVLQMIGGKAEGNEGQAKADEPASNGAGANIKPLDDEIPFAPEFR